MRTVVVHYEETPQDWSLVERFFNQGISSGSLIFFRHKVSRLAAYQELLDKVSEYLRIKMVDEWQLVWIMNISQEQDFRERLSLQLDRFQQRFLDKLQASRIAPVKTFVLAFDGLDRHTDGAPEDPFLKQVWELDIQGFLPEKPITNGNFFFEAEIMSVDQVWNGPLDLKEAGPLEAPKPEFVHLLDNRVSRVKECFRDTILIPKRKILEKAVRGASSDIPTDILLDDSLTAIEVEFYSRLNRIPEAPLSPKLVEYKPSADLKEIIGGLIGVKEAIKPYIFIRVPFPQHFPTKRVKVLLNVAYILNAIAIYPSSSRFWQEGNSYTIDVLFREKDLQILLSRYLTRLYMGKFKLGNLLENRRQDLTPDYGESMSLPFGQASLKEFDFPRLDFNYNDRLVFDQEFHHFEAAARKFLKNRGQQAAESAREGMRKLDILKKLQEEPLQMSNNKHEAALYDLTDEADGMREQLVRHIPHKSNALSSWDSYIGPVKEDLSYLLRSIPQARQIGWLSFVITSIMLIPFLIKSNEGSVISEYPIFLSNGIYPAMIIVIVLVSLGLSRLFIGNAVKKRIRTSSLRLNELMIEQADSHKEDINYLNKLYKHQKLTDRAKHLQSLHLTKLRETKQLRYHLSEIQEAIEACERLTLLHGIQLREAKDPTGDTYDELAWFNNDNIDHPIYSPLKKQNDAGAQGDKVTEIVIGQSKDTILDSRLYPAARIQCEFDRVYRL